MSTEAEQVAEARKAWEEALAKWSEADVMLKIHQTRVTLAEERATALRCEALEAARRWVTATNKAADK